MWRCTVCLLVAIASGSCATPGAQTGSGSTATTASDGKSLPLEERIYFFEHRLLPKLTYESDGKFLAELISGDTAVLAGAAAEIVSPLYAKGISMQVLDPPGAVLLTFSNPNRAPDCYYIFIARSGDGHLFFTYEKMMDLSGDNFIGMVGAWTPSGAHANFGPRKYTDASSFLSDITAILTQSRQPDAVSVPGN